MTINNINNIIKMKTDQYVSPEVRIVSCVNTRPLLTSAILLEVYDDSSTIENFIDNGDTITW
jgi:hypothetical protein